MATAQKTNTQAHMDGKGFSADEKAAMRERARELKAEQKSKDARADGERVQREKIAALPPKVRAMAERLAELIAGAAPALDPKTWYGMPAWARDGKVVCFFKPQSKFNARYATFGFEDAAEVIDGTMFVTSFGIVELTPADEARIVELVKKA
jgi:uncharacterized protein YdhG (YjbR/CyaY superfamily)